MSTASLTYVEIAARFGVTTASARNLVRRKGWPKTLGNDGLARIVVPSDAIPDAPPVRGEGSTVQPSERAEGSTVQPLEADTHAVALATLERHVARVERELETLRSERDAERIVAASHGAMVAALQATLDAVREDRDRWAAQAERLAARRWWPFRRRA
jgi:hypothetical protein